MLPIRIFILIAFSRPSPSQNPPPSIITPKSFSKRIRYYDSMGGEGLIYMNGLKMFLQDEVSIFKHKCFHVRLFKPPTF